MLEIRNSSSVNDDCNSNHEQDETIYRCPLLHKMLYCCARFVANHDSSTAATSVPKRHRSSIYPDFIVINIITITSSFFVLS